MNLTPAALMTQRRQEFKNVVRPRGIRFQLVITIKNTHRLEANATDGWHAQRRWDGPGMLKGVRPFSIPTDGEGFEPPVE